MLKEEEGAVVDAGECSPETTFPSPAARVLCGRNLLPTPTSRQRGIGEHVVEFLPGKASKDLPSPRESPYWILSIVELADKFLETAAHLQIGDDVGVKIDFREFVDEFEETVGLVDLRNLLIEAEVVEEGTGFGRKRFDVVEEVLGEPFGVGEEFGEVEPAGVIELLLRRASKHFIDERRVLTFELFLLFEDFGFGGFEDAVEAAQDGHGEHDFAVFGRAVGTAEKVGNVPDETDEGIGVIGQVMESLSGGRTRPPRMPGGAAIS